MFKKFKNKWLLNYMISFISIFMIEVFFKFLCEDSVFNWSLLRIFISTSFISVLISFICSYLKNIISMVTNIIITLGITIYAFAQLGFNNYLGVYMSLNTTSQFGAVVDYIGEYFRSFKITYYLIFIPFILLILYYVFLNKKLIIEIPKLNKNEKIKSVVRKISSFILLEISIGFIYFSTLVMPCMQNKYQLQSNKSLFINPSVPSIAIKQLGVVTFGLGDV